MSRLLVFNFKDFFFLHHPNGFSPTERRGRRKNTDNSLKCQTFTLLLYSALLRHPKWFPHVTHTGGGRAGAPPNAGEAADQQELKRRFT